MLKTGWVNKIYWQPGIRIFYRIGMMLSLFLILNSVFPQAGNNNIKKYIQVDGEAMLNAFVNKNYDTYVNFVHPNLIKAMGGKSKLIVAVKKSLSEMSSFKVSFKTGKILQLIKTAKGFQCIIESKLTLTRDKVRTYVNSAMYGFSDPTGKHWKYADVDGNEEESLRKLFPEMDKKLVIPKTETRNETIDE
jgi:hypothetical protein